MKYINTTNLKLAKPYLGPNFILKKLHLRFWFQHSAGKLSNLLCMLYFICCKIKPNSPLAEELQNLDLDSARFDSENIIKFVFKTNHSSNEVNLILFLINRWAWRARWRQTSRSTRFKTLIISVNYFHPMPNGNVEF